LNLEPNGHPLTHDLLTRLGALDHCKSDLFEENIEALQRDSWGRDTPRQGSPTGSSHTAQSPAVPLCFSPDVSQKTALSTPEINSPLNKLPTEGEPTQVTTQYITSSIQNDIDPLYLLNEPASWQANDTFSLFDEMDMMSTAENSDLIFDDPTTSPLFNRQMPFNCMMSSAYEDAYQVFTLTQTFSIPTIQISLLN
jgi:hypothetical protein